MYIVLALLEKPFFFFSFFTEYKVSAVGASKRPMSCGLHEVAVVRTPLIQSQDSTIGQGVKYMLFAYAHTVQSCWLWMAWHHEDTWKCCDQLTILKDFFEATFCNDSFSIYNLVFILTYTEWPNWEEREERQETCVWCDEYIC